MCLLLGTRNIQDVLSLRHKQKLPISVAISIDRWGPHAPRLLCVCVLAAPRELNNFGKFFPVNFVPLFPCLSCFPLRCLVFNYIVKKEVDDRGNDTTISNPSCFTNSMFGVCKVWDENFGIGYSTMTTVHSYNGDNMLLDSRHYVLPLDRVGAMKIVPNFIGVTEAFVLMLP